MPAVKGGDTGPRVPAVPAEGGLRWADGDLEVVLTADPAPEVDAAAAGSRWRFRLERGERREVVVSGPAPPRATVRGRPARPCGRSRSRPPTSGCGVPPSRASPTSTVCCSPTTATGSWPPAARGTSRCSAATPCGRRGCWCPVDTGARALDAAGARAPTGDPRRPGHRGAARQDPARGAQRASRRRAHSLPPVYYGTVDATPLFVCTLADAHAWGADRDQVRALLPAVRGCLTWQLAQSADSGWLRYVDHTGTGLANQGWKDSHDSVQFADGRLADPPIALCEVQAYAYDAAVRGAALLEAFGERAGARAGRVGRRPALAGSPSAFWVGSAGRGPRRDRPRPRRPPGRLGDLQHGTPARHRPARRGARRPGSRRARATGASTPASACAPSPPTRRGSRGSPTTAARSGRTTPRSPSGAWPRTATSTRPRDWPAGCSWPPRASTTASPSCTAATRPPTYPFPSAYPAACRPQAWSAAAPLAALVAVTGIRGRRPGRHGHPPDPHQHRPRRLLAPRSARGRGAARRARRRSRVTCGSSSRRAAR